MFETQLKELYEISKIEKNPTWWTQLQTDLFEPHIEKHFLMAYCDCRGIHWDDTPKGIKVFLVVFFYLTFTQHAVDTILKNLVPYWEVQKDITYGMKHEESEEDDSCSNDEDDMSEKCSPTDQNFM